jgi:hypothetical protein
MCMYDYADEPFFYNVEHRRAKKAHNCCECARSISIGEKYYYVSGKWVDHIGCYKTCSHCKVVQDYLTEQCGGFLHEGTLDDFEDHVPFGKLSKWRALFNMRRNWTNKKGKLVAIPQIK